MRRIGNAIKIIILVVGVFLNVWIISLVKCDVLTIMHGKEFETVYRDDTMLSEIDYLKILSYSKNSAKVYYVSENRTGGDILTFKLVDGKWTKCEWRTVWSTTGSASEVIWPYWWHFIYGGF